MTEAYLIRGGGGQGIALICLHMWSQKPPETLSDIINSSSKFSWGSTPRPPLLELLLYHKIPFPTKYNKVLAPPPPLNLTIAIFAPA